LYKADKWDEPKAHPVRAFYLVVSGNRRDIHVPVKQYYTAVEGFDSDRLSEELMDLGFYPRGKNQEPNANLRVHNSRDFFDALFDILAWVTDEFEETLRTGSGSG
jgi:hypothetical protein